MVWGIPFLVKQAKKTSLTGARGNRSTLGALRRADPRQSSHQGPFLSTRVRDKITTATTNAPAFLQTPRIEMLFV